MSTLLSTTSSGILLARAARVFLKDQPTSNELNVLVARVNQGNISLNQQIIEIANSSGRRSAEADTLTKIFFILLGRAPDLSTFVTGMQVLEQKGLDLFGLAEFGLNFQTGTLGNNLKLSNKEFIDQLADQIFGAPNSIVGVPQLAAQLTHELNMGRITRAEIIVKAAQFESPGIRYEQDVNTALYYLATHGREASMAELTAQRGKVPGLMVRDLLVDSGHSPTSTTPYFSFSDAALTITGSFSDSLFLSLDTGLSQLGTSTNHRIIYSLDNSQTEQSVFSRSLPLNLITEIDAVGIGPQAKGFSVKAGSLGIKVHSPNVPSSLIGGLGNDVLIGGAANDQLHASAGQDLLTGGAGNDIFTLAEASTYRNLEAFTTISDFGNGGDQISFSKLLGAKTTPKVAKPIVGTADRAAGFADLTAVTHNSIILINNTGQWVDEVPSGNKEIDLAPRTADQIAALFTTNIDADGNALESPSPITFKTLPTRSASYVLITFDPVNGADMWLIDNFSNLAEISASEVRLIGTILPTTGDLWVSLNTNAFLL